MADPGIHTPSDAPTALPPSQWWEIKVVGVPLLDDLLFWRLQEEGCQGTASQIVNQELTVCGYLSLDRVQSIDLQKIAERLHQDVQSVGHPAPDISWQLITEEDWAHNWRDYWHPQEVGNRLLIYPAWLEVPAQCERLLIRLNPGVAFGTGAHATTQLCLRALEQQISEQSNPLSIADIGCGTGILSIAALLLGVQKAYAVDLDPLAIGATQASRELNGLTSDQLWVKEGSLDQVIQQLQHPVQGFCCNILAHIILDLIPHFADITDQNGWGILSGILDTQEPMIIEALNAHGWQVRDTHHEQDWCSLIIERS
ncbi:50S ribosomal protein L11 methyltransferase [Acaryochloris sp. CCMEE 5410]|uniref:50S ribosomal protein L11 methyltransferase n=1 Tax=Acaryochloris sp. CCMEE 5410 TaxID=310037 RepID=UPI0002484DAA|nr:50S ribosomal protein L11 methyltransferase [Acaryochloris sp. CCMEE 5410]KAI9131144.1 50S ribosomal protein L11 methyltransferase [Acaryochloris sp. CCMEE 5410]